MNKARPYPTRDRLHELFDYSEGAHEMCGRATVGGLIWRPKQDSLGRWNTREVDTFAGTVRKGDSRVQVLVDGKLYELNRLVYIWHHGEIPEGMFVDHRDRDVSDNRIGGLRLATNSQNNQNRTPKKGTSRFVGVYWRPDMKRWQAQIKIGGKNVYVGVFRSEEKAAIARDEYAKRLHGEFAVLNGVDA